MIGAIGTVLVAFWLLLETRRGVAAIKGIETNPL